MRAACARRPRPAAPTAARPGAPNATPPLPPSTPRAGSPRSGESLVNHRATPSPASLRELRAAGRWVSLRPTTRARPSLTPDTTAHRQQPRRPPRTAVHRNNTHCTINSSLRSHNARTDPRLPRDRRHDRPTLARTMEQNNRAARPDRTCSRYGKSTCSTIVTPTQQSQRVLQPSAPARQKCKDLAGTHHRKRPQSQKGGGRGCLISWRAGRGARRRGGPEG